MTARSLAWMGCAVLALATFDASAQGYPKRGGAGQRGEMNKGDSQQRPAPVSTDPFGALERELPSLKVDLLIREDQLDAWRIYERDVRDLAEMERSRRRHLLALKSSGETPPTAITFINSLVEDDRQRVEAGIELKRHVEQLYGRLDDSQRRTFDRRTIQSQTEPLAPPAR